MHMQVCAETLCKLCSSVQFCVLENNSTITMSMFVYVVYDYVDGHSLYIPTLVVYTHVFIPL